MKLLKKLAIEKYSETVFVKQMIEKYPKKKSRQSSLNKLESPKQIGICRTT